MSPISWGQYECIQSSIVVHSTRLKLPQITSDILSLAPSLGQKLWVVSASHPRLIALSLGQNLQRWRFFLAGSSLVHWSGSSALIGSTWPTSSLPSYIRKMRRLLVTSTSHSRLIANERLNALKAQRVKLVKRMNELSSCKPRREIEFDAGHKCESLHVALCMFQIPACEKKSTETPKFFIKRVAWWWNVDGMDLALERLFGPWVEKSNGFRLGWVEMKTIVQRSQLWILWVQDSIDATWCANA